jgi:RHS repeat-associated protein
MREESYMIGTPYRVAHQLRCGEQQASGNNPTPYGYKGQWGYYTDGETGLLLLTHRYLDPATGRFLTRNPVGFDGGINLYAYVGNGVVMQEDRMGLKLRSPRLTTILVCRRPVSGLENYVWGCCDPMIFHYLIAAGGKIIEVPAGSTGGLTEIPRPFDCKAYTVTEHEKKCVISYGSWLQDKWAYLPLLRDCQHFVRDVLGSCLLHYDPTDPFLNPRTWGYFERGARMYGLYDILPL